MFLTMLRKTKEKEVESIKKSNKKTKAKKLKM